MIFRNNAIEKTFSFKNIFKLFSDEKLKIKFASH